MSALFTILVVIVVVAVGAMVALHFLHNKIELAIEKFAEGKFAEFKAWAEKEISSIKSKL